MPRVLVVTLLALAACSSVPDARPPVLPLASASVWENEYAEAYETFTPVPGTRYPYRLYTHCGVVQASFAGSYWQAEPAISDGQGNPPIGWGNPGEDGTMELRPDGSLLFRGRAGHMARFVKPPTGFTPLICD
jgi:hypothetical protein